MSESIADLFARIGLDVDHDKVTKFSKGLSSALVVMNSGVQLADKFISIFNKLSSEIFSTALSLSKFKAETGASMEELQRWKAVADKTNGSSKALEESIKQLTLNSEQIKLGQGNISGYQLLGIDPHQDPFQILKQLRTQTENLAPAMKKNVLGMMGVSSDLLQILNLSNKEFDKMYKGAFVIPTSAINSINKAGASIREFTQLTTYLRTKITAQLSPMVEKLMNDFINWYKVNQTKIEPMIKKITEGISRMVQAGSNAVKMIDKLVTNTIGWKNGIMALVGVFAILNAHLLASPIGMISTAIILLLLILDDLYVYSTGKGKSLFGVMMEKFPKMKESIDGIINTIKDVKEFFKIFGDGSDLDGIDAMLDKLGLLGKIMEGLIGIGDLFYDHVIKPLMTYQEKKAITEESKEKQEKAVINFVKGESSFLETVNKLNDAFIEEVQAKDELKYKPLNKREKARQEKKQKEDMDFFEKMQNKQTDYQNMLNEKLGNQATELQNTTNTTNSNKTINITNNLKTDVRTQTIEEKKIADNINKNLQNNLNQTLSQLPVDE